MARKNDRRPGGWGIAVAVLALAAGAVGAGVGAARSTGDEIVGLTTQDGILLRIWSDGRVEQSHAIPAVLSGGPIDQIRLVEWAPVDVVPRGREPRPASLPAR